MSARNIQPKASPVLSIGSGNGEPPNGKTDYEQRLEDLGIDRGQLARGFEDIHRGAIGHEPMLLNADASMVVKAPPMNEDFTKLNGQRWTRAQRQGRKGGLQTQRKAKA